jgi:predicted 3-demethylubiquinone-9 3-methyltransferase (glyoxalase superfamily)
MLGRLYTTKDGSIRALGFHDFLFIEHAANAVPVSHQEIKEIMGLLPVGKSLVTSHFAAPENFHYSYNKQRLPMQKITPFLMFDDKAEEAMRFYVSVFKNSKILSLNRRGDDETGSVTSGTFQLEGQEFMAFNGGPHFKFSEGISLFVSCKTQEEVNELWEKLCRGGQPQRCGWLKDKFGVPWQIIPCPEQLFVSAKTLS